MKTNWNSSQFWLTVTTIVAATAALVTGKIDAQQWTVVVTAASASLGVRKAAEHFRGGNGA